MKVGDIHYRSIWHDDADGSVKIIDQRWLPHTLEIIELDSTKSLLPPSAKCGCVVLH